MNNLSQTVLRYLVVEDIPDVADRLVHEMKRYPEWENAGTAQSVRQAKQLIDAHRPTLLFCDWDLVGGSGFEVLQHIGLLQPYEPFVVFNTGFQSDHPEIAEELINTYKVDAFINKPYWQKLVEQLPVLLQKAMLKSTQTQAGQLIWLRKVDNQRHRVDGKLITAIVQCPENPRNKLVYLLGQPVPLACTLTWRDAADLLERSGESCFAINRRYALISKLHVQRYQPPYVWVGHPPLKLEVVKENLRDFEKWMEA